MTTLGPEIQDVDLRTIDDGEFAAIYRAWLDHLAILVRGQVLTDEDLIAFSQRFGDLDWAPVQETGRRFVEGHPEIRLTPPHDVRGNSGRISRKPSRRHTR